MADRRFPPPWSVEDMGACFVVKDSSGQKLGCECIVSKRLGSRYRSSRSPDWLKVKNPAAPSVKNGGERRLFTRKARRIASKHRCHPGE
jgi:hypothetical protein